MIYHHNTLLRKWAGVIELSSHIFTWTEPLALAYCAEVASKSNYGVELGSYMGRSALVMLLANPNLHLWCVDGFNTLVAGTLECCQYFMRDQVRDGRVEFITGDSAKGASMLQHMRGKLDFCWTDDGHSTDDLIRDCRSFFPLLKTGGEMFGHDWEGDNDVARGVKSVFPIVEIEIPVPRVWSVFKKKDLTD